MRGRISPEHSGESAVRSDGSGRRSFLKALSEVQLIIGRDGQWGIYEGFSLPFALSPSLLAQWRAALMILSSLDVLSHHRSVSSVSCFGFGPAFHTEPCGVEMGVIDTLPLVVLGVDRH